MLECDLTLERGLYKLMQLLSGSLELQKLSVPIWTTQWKEQILTKHANNWMPKFDNDCIIVIFVHATVMMEERWDVKCVFKLFIK